MNRHGDLFAPAKQLKRRRLRRRMLIWSVLLVLVLGGLIWFVNQEPWLIQTVEVTGNRLVSTSALTETAGTVLAGRWLGLFSRRHILWYPKTELLATLYKKFPRLAVAQLAIDYPRLRLTTSEREPVAVWCPRTTTPTDFCYFIDPAGTVFSLAPRFSEPVFFTLVSDWGEVTPLGQVPIPADEVARLLFFKNELRQLFSTAPLNGFQAVRAEPLGAGDYDFLIARYRGGFLEPVIIKVNVHRDLNNTVPLLAAALASGEVRSEITLNGHVPRVFDLRFPGKVFYRFKLEADPVLPPAPPQS
mgnify:CR=1 FL=1